MCSIAPSKYEEWIKRQPRSFQDDVLGEEQAELLRKGQLSVSRFIDNNPEVLSLKELKRKEPAAFDERAGIE